MKEKRNALWLDNEIDSLTWHGQFGTQKLDLESAEMLKKFFDVLKVFKPISEGTLNDKKYTFWFPLASPTLEEYQAEYQADYEEDHVAPDELEGYWKEAYPYHVCWYELTAITHQDNDQELFCGVFIGNNYVLSIGDCNENKNGVVNAVPLIDFLIEKAEETMQLVKEGVYNKSINESLPYRYRHGTIDRKTYYDLFPDEKVHFIGNLTEKEIQEFLPYALAEDIPEDKLIPQMTARIFFEACTAGYKECGYKEKKSFLFHDTEEEHQRYGKYTPRERYSMYADGRDDGLSRLPLDDPKAFLLWDNREEPYYQFSGCHPYEVRSCFFIKRSIHLYPWKKDWQDKDSGWCFMVSCTEPGETEEVVRWTLGLAHAHYPVKVYGGKSIADRLMATDRIGINPEDAVIFRETNCGTFDRSICDVVCLNSEAYNDQNVTSKVDWLPEEQVELANCYNSATHP